MKKFEQELAKLASEDYQGRGGNYPRPNKPDTITVNGATISAEFKNTTEGSAAAWLKNHVENLGFRVKGKVETFQSGDYQDDWVTAYLTVSGFKKR